MKQNLLVTIAVVALTTAIITAALAPVSKSIGQQPQDSFKQSKKSFKQPQKNLVDEVWQIVNYRYVDGTFNGQNWQAIRIEYLVRSYSSQQDAYQAIRQMLEKLGDRFTRFMDPEEFKAMQVDSLRAAVGLTVKDVEKTSELVVISPIEDTPAYKAGILSGDVLVKIDGLSTQGMNATNAVRRVQGKVGTPVVLTVMRGKKQLEFKIVREKIELRPVSYQVEKTSKNNIGYIRLKQFSATAGKEMQDAIKDLENKQVAGYILDLRSNSGGLLFSIVDIAQMWINQGTIVSTVVRKSGIERQQADGRALTDKPLMIIINEGTTSGAEILTAALQENNRAKLLGVKTLGYNTIQSVQPLQDGSGLAVTVAKWLTPKGRDINNLGIVPDVVVNLTSSQQQAMIQNRSFGTIADLQYSKAVEQLTQLIQKSNDKKQ
jgi:carboxyl-terminal processing protease